MIPISDQQELDETNSQQQDDSNTKALNRYKTFKIKNKHRNNQFINELNRNLNKHIQDNTTLKLNEQITVNKDTNSLNNDSDEDDMLIDAATSSHNTVASLSLAILVNDKKEDLSLQMDSNNSIHRTDLHLQHYKLNKDLNKEERLRLVKEKRELEIEKRKKEIEDNLKRKQELRDKQLKERQKRIDELKLKENEKRLAVEERRRQREESARVRLNELVKREQEREKQAKLANKLNNITKGSEWTLSTAPNSVTTSEAASNLIDQMTTINKSQSAYNLNLNHLNPNKKKESLLTTSVYTSSGLTSNEITNTKKTSTSTQRLNNSSTKNQDTNNAALNPINEQSTLSSLLKRISNNDNLDTTKSNRRSRTVPTTPKHTLNNQQDDTKMVNITTTNNNSNNNNNSQLNKSLYWEGPPAHFMLPTHADHCRSSRSIERCPRASKVLADQLETLANEQQLQKPLQTITERKPLPAHLQQFVNRLSTPKKINDESSTSTSFISNSNRALTPQPNESTNSHSNITERKTKPLKAFALNDLDFAKPTQSTQLKKSSSKSSHLNDVTQTISAAVTPTPIRKQINPNCKNDLKVIGAITQAKNSAFSHSSSNGNIVNLGNGFQSNQLINSKKSQSNSSSTLTKPKQTNKNNNNNNKIEKPDNNKELVISVTEPVVDSVATPQTVTTSPLLKETDQLKLEEESNCSSNSVSQQKEIVKIEPTATVVVTPPVVTPTPVAPVKVSMLSNEEEEYKKKLEEKRREAREKAAKEAELERQRQEAIRLVEEKQKQEEEELERLAEEEELRLNKLARQQEEERLRLAIEQNERVENERRLKEEQEKKQKEDNEKKAKEESERNERERLEKIKKEEEERLERRKKVDMIMRRVHKEDNSQSSLNGSSGNLLMSASNTDLANASMNGSMISTTNNPIQPISMTTSMINTSTNDLPTDQMRFKTPLLHSILSKTRITNILNKYADDPILSSSTLSIMAQSNQQKQIKTDENKDDSLVKDLKDLKRSEQIYKDDDYEVQNKIRFDLQLNEVEVVVDTSSPSSSPSSPTSSTSSNTSLNENDHVSSASSTQEQQQQTPSPTQISA